VAVTTNEIAPAGEKIKLFLVPAAAKPVAIVDKNSRRTTKRTQPALSFIDLFMNQFYSFNNKNVGSAKSCRRRVSDANRSRQRHLHP